MTDDERNEIIARARRLSVAALESWRDELVADDPVRAVIADHLDGRTVTMSVRVSYAERKRLRELAEQQGYGPSELLKACFLSINENGAVRLPTARNKPGIDPQQAREMLSHLGKLGSNINQLTKRVHVAAREGKKVTPKLDALQQTQQDISDMRRQITELLR